MRQREWERERDLWGGFRREFREALEADRRRRVRSGINAKEGIVEKSLLTTAFREEEAWAKGESGKGWGIWNRHCRRFSDHQVMHSQRRERESESCNFSWNFGVSGERRESMEASAWRQRRNVNLDGQFQIPISLLSLFSALPICFAPWLNAFDSLPNFGF